MIIRESRIYCLVRQLLIFDVGTLVYPVIGIKQHAAQSVTSTVNGLVNPTYTYDSVGNLTEEKTGATVQRSITWTGFNIQLTCPAQTLIHCSAGIQYFQLFFAFFGNKIVFFHIPRNRSLAIVLQTQTTNLTVTGNGASVVQQWCIRKVDTVHFGA